MPIGKVFSAKRARSTSSGTSNYSTGSPTGTRTSGKQAHQRLKDDRKTYCFRDANKHTRRPGSVRPAG